MTEAIAIAAGLVAVVVALIYALCPYSTDTQETS